MNKLYIIAILAVTSLAFSVGAMAQNMSKSEYKAAEKNIKAEYKSAKANCGSFADNVKDICMAEAKGMKCIDTLTGFKHIGTKLLEYEQKAGGRKQIGRAHV